MNEPNNYYRDLDHDELMDAIKSAATCEAKVNALADLVYKILINDLHCLEDRISKVESFMWKATGIISAAVVVANILVKVLFK